MNQETKREQAQEINKLRKMYSLTWQSIYNEFKQHNHKNSEAFRISVTRGKSNCIPELLEFLKGLSKADIQRIVYKGSEAKKYEVIFYEVCELRRKLGIPWLSIYEEFEHENLGAFKSLSSNKHAKYLPDLLEFMKNLSQKDIDRMKASHMTIHGNAKSVSEEDKKIAKEILELKKERGITWEQIYKHFEPKEYKTCNGYIEGVKKGYVKNLPEILEYIKTVKKEEVTKKERKIKKRGRAGAYYNGRRMVRVYTIEDGVFMLKEEYLE